MIQFLRSFCKIISKNADEKIAKKRAKYLVIEKLNSVKVTLRRQTGSIAREIVGELNVIVVPV